MKNVLICASLLGSMLTFAQEKDSIKGNDIEEVIVKGKYYQKYKLDEVSGSLRLQTPILELPQNVQTISTGILADQITLNMSEGIVRNVSGARKVEHWDNVYSNVFMRGASIATYMNGMNVTSTWGPINPDVSIIDRIEFVKGPAGFMGSMGDPAGFYNVVTKKPTGKFQNSVRFTTGSYNLFRGEADLDGVIIKNGVLDYRLNLMGSTNGSWVENDKTKKIIVAPSITFRPTKTTTLTAQYNYQFLKFSQPGAYLMSNDGYASLNVHTNFNDKNFKETEVKDQSLFLTLDQKLSKDWLWSTQYAYMDLNYDGGSWWGSFDTKNSSIFNRTLSNWQAVGKNHIFQTYVRGSLKTGNITHKIIAGFDYGERKYNADFSGYANGVYPLNIYHPQYGVDPSTLPSADFYTLNPSAPFYNDQGVKYTSYYAQDQIEMFNNKLRLTLGGRYTNGTTYAGYPFYSENNIVPKDKADEFTPRVGLSYSFKDDFSVYGVFDKTFAPQSGIGKNNTSITDPFKGQNIEFGLKKDWFNGKWNTTFAFYEIRRKNILVAGNINENNGIAFQVATGEQRARGFETDIKGEIFKGLNVVINYAYTDAKTVKDTDPARIGVQSPGNAKNVQNTWLSYRFENGMLKGFGISAGYQYQGGRQSWFGTTAKYDQRLEDYFDTNFGISYAAKKFDVNLLLNNTLNRKLYSGYRSDDGSYAWIYNAPRNWRLSVGYKF
ncbi:MULTISPECIES: TonB-dependent siderophore receptor [unclassified Chryseobacterium]|uniref:TonB-dependent siderophore receptor n=1 Tax=unclassified Chryseobacterium TaxID=2593645 RepID=UPI000D3B0C45|nr:MULTISPECIES: TonB-dependent siderophore receptor [unclassified Chryseobacterium]PTT77409.1 TonB-dependent siderophore receptor [Chryseobacterium sp. HMWF001]PVV51047.1 TonB-dependent siderophore receptor [Chryseobacterium sp. HMWF035]